MYTQQRRKYISKLQKKDRLSEKDCIALCKYAHDVSTELRTDVAELLCDHYSSKVEKTLIRMTYDPTFIVKINAIDSLCIGKSEKALKRLYVLSKSYNELIRAYAVMSSADIIANRGIKEENRKFLVWLQRFIKQEKSNCVKIMLLEILYKNGDKQSLNQMIDIITKEVNEGESRNVWLIINVLDEILDKENCDEVVEFLIVLLKYVNTEQKKRIIEMIQKQ